jgi:hypothetical protein
LIDSKNALREIANLHAKSVQSIATKKTTAHGSGR